VIAAFAVAVATTIHDGNLAFVSRNPFVARLTNPDFVLSEKNSYRKIPMTRFSR
jgi:hypothetical protein